MDAQESEQAHQIVLRLTGLYQFKHFVRPEHHLQFRLSLDVHLHKPVADLLVWLANHSDHIHDSHAQAVVLNVTHTLSLTSYF